MFAKFYAKLFEIINKTESNLHQSKK